MSLPHADPHTVTVRSRPSPLQNRALPAHTAHSDIKHLGDRAHSLSELRVFDWIKSSWDSNLDAVVCRDSQFLQIVHWVLEMTLHSHCFRRLCHRYLLTYLQKHSDNQLQQLTLSHVESAKLPEVCTDRIWVFFCQRRWIVSRGKVINAWTVFYLCSLTCVVWKNASSNCFIECGCGLLPFDFRHCCLTGNGASRCHDLQNSLWLQL